MEEGRKEERIETARGMLNANVLVSDIARFTNLTEAEINSLK